MPADADQLTTALDHLQRLVDGVGDDQWDGPTPCEEWTVTDLVHHVALGNLIFAAALRDEEPALPQGPQHDVPAGFRASATSLAEEFAAPGVLDRPVRVPFGHVPGMVALHLRLVETLVHGWDLARATGQSAPFDDELVEQELAATETMLEQLPPDRVPFKPSQSVPHDAPPLDRLAARLGRRVP